jgi:hypothetical protein
MDLYRNSPIRLHSVVLNLVSTGATLPFYDGCAPKQREECALELTRVLLCREVAAFTACDKYASSQVQVQGWSQWFMQRLCLSLRRRPGARCQAGHRRTGADQFCPDRRLMPSKPQTNWSRSILFGWSVPFRTEWFILLWKGKLSWAVLGHDTIQFGWWLPNFTEEPVASTFMVCVLLGMTLCSLVGDYQRFGETCFHIQGHLGYELTAVDFSKTLVTAC